MGIGGVVSLVVIAGVACLIAVLVARSNRKWRSAARVDAPDEVPETYESEWKQMSPRGGRGVAARVAATAAFEMDVDDSGVRGVRARRNAARRNGVNSRAAPSTIAAWGPL